jgi:hypothetical protein
MNGSCENKLCGDALESRLLLLLLRSFIFKRLEMGPNFYPSKMRKLIVFSRPGSGFNDNPSSPLHYLHFFISFYFVFVSCFTTQYFLQYLARLFIRVFIFFNMFFFIQLFFFHLGICLKQNKSIMNPTNT